MSEERTKLNVSNGSSPILLELFKAVQSGDSWRLKDVETSEIHYVSEGCTVTLI